MRAFFITLVLIAALGAGARYYWQKHPEVFEAPPPAEAAPPPVVERPRPRAEACATQDAVYAIGRNQNVTLRLAPGPEGVTAVGEGAEQFDHIGDIVFVVSAGEREFRFASAASIGVSTNYMFPMNNVGAVSVPAGVDLIQLGAFDATWTYLPGLPLLDHSAPPHLYAPNLARWLYNNSGEPRIEMPIGFIEFASCDPQPGPTPNADAAAPEAPPPG